MRATRRLTAAVLLAVNVPIIVAVVRALAHGWQPVGDNGILLVRARDVATSHHPLLGSWTSASLVLDKDVNNPGPLYFDAIAPTVKLLGPWVGVAVGVMLVNMAASSLAVLAARRISGTESMVAVAIVTVGLQFAMGSELLFDMWQPNALVLPFLAFLVVVTVLATGDLVMAPWVVGLGSLIVQTHMSHAALVLALTVAGAVGCVLSLRRRDAPPSWRRPLGLTRCRRRGGLEPAARRAVHRSGYGQPVADRRCRHRRRRGGDRVVARVAADGRDRRDGTVVHPQRPMPVRCPRPPPMARSMASSVSVRLSPCWRRLPWGSPPPRSGRDGAVTAGRRRWSPWPASPWRRRARRSPSRPSTTSLSRSIRCGGSGPSPRSSPPQC